MTPRVFKSHDGLSAKLIKKHEKSRFFYRRRRPIFCLYWGRVLKGASELGNGEQEEKTHTGVVSDDETFEVTDSEEEERLEYRGARVREEERKEQLHRTVSVNKKLQ